MKKFLKNVLLSFMIIYTILNIVNIIYENVYIDKKITERVFIEGEGNRNDYYEELYQTFIEKYGEEDTELIETTIQELEMFERSFNTVLNIASSSDDREIIILVASVIIGLAIGAIKTFERKGGVKDVLIFVCIGIILAFGYTAVEYLICQEHVVYYVNTNFFEQLLYVFEEYYIIYTLIYLVGYILMYIIKKKKVKELNEELKK